jgi:hypothetical protein
MIGTIRKHSKWLWVIIIAATIISFVWWGAAPATRGGAGGAAGLGKIYGVAVTPQEYEDAKAEFRLFYFTHYGAWPEGKANITTQDIEKETYVRLLMVRKASKLGVQVGEDAIVAGAQELLSSPGLLKMFHSNAKSIPMDQFEQTVLESQKLTAADFERYVRNDIAIQQLYKAYGTPGRIISPQEAAMLYDHDRQQVSADVVFFTASNYLAQVTTTPQAVGRFYSNYLAEYRLPDRVQIKYVEFPVSNYLAQAKADVSTNLETIVNNYYAENGMNAVPGAKTEAEAKDKIRDLYLRQRAGQFARTNANTFESAISAFDSSTVKPEFLDQVAQKSGVAVHTTAPFSAEYGPEEFYAPDELTKIAFQLNADEPISSPIPGADAYYIIALAKNLPSEIPPLSEIQSQVTRDYQRLSAAFLARQAGTNFSQIQLPIQLAVKKSFASAASAAGLKPEALPAFSQSTESVSGFEQRGELAALKYVAFGTEPGHASQFIPTPDGGFLVYVNSLLPVDESEKQADLPDFTAQLRRSRENEAINQWINAEANKELKGISLLRDQAAGAKAGQ